MTVDELKSYVGAMLTATFPTVTIRFERIGDDPFHIGIGVYGVDAAATKWVTERILDIDEKLCAGTDFVITPLVRDEETTARFYPELSSPWKASFTRAVSHVVTQRMTLASDAWLPVSGVKTDANWELPDPALTFAAANEQLPLAA